MLKRALLCSAAILFAAGIGMAAPKKAPGKTISRTGWITDSRCGAKGASASHLECLKKCIAAGEKYVLYDPYNKKIYQLDPQSSAAEHPAQRVHVTGRLEGDTIHVVSMREVASRKTKAKPAGKKS